MLCQLSCEQFIKLSIKNTVGHKLQIDELLARYELHARTLSSMQEETKPLMHLNISSTGTFLFLLIWVAMFVMSLLNLQVLAKANECNTTMHSYEPPPLTLR